MAGPCHVEHLLQGKRCDFKEPSSSGVGVGDDCTAFSPALLPLHHDVAVWERFVKREQLAVVFGDLFWCVVAHLFLNLVGGFVEQVKGCFVHPCVVGGVVVGVRAINHEVRVGVVLFVHNVLVREKGDDVLDDFVG